MNPTNAKLPLGTLWNVRNFRCLQIFAQQQICSSCGHSNDRIAAMIWYQRHYQPAAIFKPAAGWCPINIFYHRSPPNYSAVHTYIHASPHALANPVTSMPTWHGSFVKSSSSSRIEDEFFALCCIIRQSSDNKYCRYGMNTILLCYIREIIDDTDERNLKRCHMLKGPGKDEDDDDELLFIEAQIPTPNN